MKHVKKIGKVSIFEKNTRAVIAAGYVRVESDIPIKEWGRAFGCVVDVESNPPTCHVWTEHRKAGRYQDRRLEFDPTWCVCQHELLEAYSVAVDEWQLRLHRTDFAPYSFSLELWRNGNLLAVLEWWDTEGEITAHVEGELRQFEVFAEAVLEAHCKPTKPDQTEGGTTTMEAKQRSSEASRSVTETMTQTQDVVPSHNGEANRFLFWFNLLCQKLYSGGVLVPKEKNSNPDGKIGDYAFIREGHWVEIPALTIDYRNGHKPFGSKAFSALGYEFYVFRGVSYPEAKRSKETGTFRVGNGTQYLAQQVVSSWVKLGGKAKLEKDADALVCVGKGDVWLSLYG